MVAPILRMLAVKAAPSIIRAIPRLRPALGAPLHAHIMKSTNKAIPPTPITTRMPRGRNDYMYATVRNHHIVAHLGPFRTGNPRVFESIRTYGSWAFRVLAKRAFLYVMILGVVALGMFSEEDNVEELRAAQEEVEKRVQEMEEQQRREYEVWLARMGRYGENGEGLSSI